MSHISLLSECINCVLNCSFHSILSLSISVQYTVEYVTFFSYAIHTYCSMMANKHKTGKREKGRRTAFCKCSIAWNMGRGRPTPIGWLIFAFSIVWIDSICDMEIFYKYMWTICFMVYSCVLAWMQSYIYANRKICACDLTRVNVYVDELQLFARFIFGTKEIFIYLIIFRFDFYQLMKRMNITNHIMILECMISE